MEFTFDHSQDSVLEACGVTEASVENLFDKLNDIGNSCTCSSEIIEKIGKAFSSTELAFVVNHLQMQLSDYPSQMIRQLIDEVKTVDLPGEGGLA